MKKAFSLVILVVCALILFTSCGKDDAKVVREIPAGFIQLPKGGGNWANGLHYVAWESQISFLDIDEKCVYQTGFNNSDFIVKYKNEYYVNENEFWELVDMAKLAFEKRNSTSD
jgi:hypothetical protein